MRTEITIGCETWSYEVDGSYTTIYSPDGESILHLWWVMNEGEVKAAVWGWIKGCHLGRKQGKAIRIAESRQRDCLPNIPE